MGDTVNLAARLMQKADFGEIWVDHPVQAQAVDVFDFDDLGCVQIKGKTEPRQVYRALGEKEQDQEMEDFLMKTDSRVFQRKLSTLISN